MDKEVSRRCYWNQEEKWKIEQVTQDSKSQHSRYSIDILLEYTLTLWKSETVHGTKNNPDCTKFFQISKKEGF